MTLLGKWASKIVIFVILLITIAFYYLHISNQNPLIGIADKNTLFAITSLFAITLLVAVVNFLKEAYDEKVRAKIANISGSIALIALFAGSLLLFRIFWTGNPPTWISDLFIQIMTITAVGCIALTPRKGSYNMAASMIFPLMGIIFYLSYRF